jgi:hypothetical protein
VSAATWCHRHGESGQLPANKRYAQSREHAFASPPRFKHPAGILMLFWLSDII